jgi:hypothetical protein
MVISEEDINSFDYYGKKLSDIAPNQLPNYNFM